MKHKDYYTPPEVAEMFNVKVLTIYRWINAGIMPATKQGQWHIAPEAIDEAVEALRRKGKQYTNLEQYTYNSMRKG